MQEPVTFSPRRNSEKPASSGHSKLLGIIEDCSAVIMDDQVVNHFKKMPYGI